MPKFINLILSLFGLVEKAIPSDEIREGRFEIKKPKTEKKVQEWLEKKWKQDTEAKLRTLNLDNRKAIDKKLKSLIEWGAEPKDIEVQDGYLLFKYVRDGVEGSERMKIS